ncbi:hypothetical protein D9M71_307810 [compost metagenome]
MFIGVILHYLHCKKLDPIMAYVGAAGLFTLFYIHWWLGPYSASLALAWNYAFAVLSFIFAHTFPNLFKANRLFNFLANISYPLYVIHGVTGYVALRVMLELGFKAWVSLLVVTTTILYLSWLLHVLVERPSQVLGKRLGAKLSGAPVQTTPIFSQLN